MNTFVKNLKEKGDFFGAYLVLKNLFSKELGSKELFSEYIDLALEIASYNINFEDRKQYLQDADMALNMFSEAVVMDEDVLSLIKDTRSRISSTYNNILTDEKEYLKTQHDRELEYNTEILVSLSELYKQLCTANTQEALDALLIKISAEDAKLQKHVLSATQQKTYDSLTKNFSKTIAVKLDELNHKSLLAYNEKAVKSFNDVFTAIKRNPSQYKDESVLKNLVMSKLFVYDTSKLFNETLVFYNHVYALVFQETDDKMKFKLTEWAIKTRKLAN